ncbi:MAG: hypothetical protein UU24_C0018G0008 [Candidatus Nomurabacteria bacterium GW2011_GWA2_40_9]|uniref:Uncharacterized protein n=1 Tax=Candidatus Nomurabacteria bacterium GW2011_GWA2_40_9 TaxID=1618734 RepID=A0A0G0TW17_9BACT|nr:MAG: hypothetical protein UU24_C0018G0008 [Candidatus Nomurabacteria bacterium GW2011_GWA2_40_9]
MEKFENKKNPILGFDELQKQLGIRNVGVGNFILLQDGLREDGYNQYKAIIAYTDPENKITSMEEITVDGGLKESAGHTLRSFSTKEDFATTYEEYAGQFFKEKKSLDKNAYNFREKHETQPLPPDSLVGKSFNDFLVKNEKIKFNFRRGKNSDGEEELYNGFINLKEYLPENMRDVYGSLNVTVEEPEKIKENKNGKVILLINGLRVLSCNYSYEIDSNRVEVEIKSEENL